MFGRGMGLFDGVLSEVGVRILMQDHKSLRGAVVIWETKVNTDRHKWTQSELS